MSSRERGRARVLWPLLLAACVGAYQISFRTPGLSEEEAVRVAEEVDRVAALHGMYSSRERRVLHDGTVSLGRHQASSGSGIRILTFWEPSTGSARVVVNDYGHDTETKGMAAIRSELGEALDRLLEGRHVDIETVRGRSIPP